MTTFTLAGSATSALVGYGVALAGGMVLPESIGLPALLLVLAVASAAIAREAGWVALPLPQLRRQTSAVWAKRRGGVATAVLWGLDLGLVFTTWLNFSGVWLLVVFAFLTGEPVFGVVLFTAYWFGRALSVWIAPGFIKQAVDTPILLAVLHQQRRLFQRIHVAGLVLLIVVIGSWIATGTTI